MAVPKRTGAMLLAAAALGLSTTGVVVAATDANPQGVVRDTLLLHGYPPTSANLLVTLSAGQTYGLTANVNVDFTNNAVGATVNFPLVVSVSSIQLRLTGGHLYVGSAVATSAKWMAIAMKSPSLLGLALELTKPHIALIRGFARASSTTNGFITTYTFRRDHVAVSNILAFANRTGELGTLVWTVNTGAEGEVIASTVIVTSRRSTTTLSAQVLSYNHSGHVTAPPPSDVVPASGSILREILHSALLNNVMLPQNFATLGQMNLN